MKFPGAYAFVPVIALTTRCLAQSGAAEAEPAGSGEVMASDSSRDVPAWHEMITNIPGDWVRGAELTARWSSLPTIAGLGLLTGGLMAVDHRMYGSTRDLSRHSTVLRSGCELFVHVGNGTTHIALAAGFGLYGWIASDSRSLRTASQTVESMLAAGIVVQVLKHVTGRESPAEATRDGGKWQFFPNWNSYARHPARYYAFPSGHIATTMSTVTVIAENYPEASWIRPVGYAVVGLVGIGLVNVGFHWYSDLPLGIALGYAMGMVAAHREPLPPDSAKELETAPRLSFAPSLTPEGGGFTLALSF